MGARIWTKWSVLAALLMIAGAGGVGYAQFPGVGSINGKLTDTRSMPLDGVTVTLLNEATGAEVRTTTVRGGSYRFAKLDPGEYTLVAESLQLGRGQVSGIFVSAGHESRVQTAIEFESLPLEPLTVQIHSPEPQTPYPSAQTATGSQIAQLFRADEDLSRLGPTTPEVNVTLDAEAFLTLPIRGGPNLLRNQRAPVNPPSAVLLPASRPTTNHEHPLAAIAVATQPVVSYPMSSPSAGETITATAPSTITLPHSQPDALGSALVRIEISAVQANIRIAHMGSKEHLAAVARNAVAPTSTTLTSEQLQALPIPGRNWESFMLDASAQSESDEIEDRASTRGGAVSNEVTVDGADIRLAFGAAIVSRSSVRGASLIGPGASEVAFRAVQLVVNKGASSLIRGAGRRANIQTRRGANDLHGQAFIFDRQNIWGARNPFTQWVQETAPATPTTIATFTPKPYSPSNYESTWGFGWGGKIRRDHLYWFASVDAYDRNNSGVSAVKHPDNFFAQPSNDQMQVLSARLGLSSTNPVSAGLAAYSKMLETLSSLLGPAARTSSQWSGFGRIDWKPAERHSFTLEGSGAHVKSPGGGLTRASENYGSHSFGSSRVSEEWLQGRWEAFLNQDLLATTQVSFGHHIRSASPEIPSTYEQTLNINAWGQLPQIVVDSRYGFTIGNPARFGSGSYPDEHLYHAQEQVSWVRGPLMINAGFGLDHNTDATSRLRNQTGTYNYSSVENFASDALAFAAFGLNGQLDPMDQHNCDQTGRTWRDTEGTLHGLGYLPCYSSYSQTMGPTNWWLSTSDWAGFLTSQWQPAKRVVFSLGLRLEHQQLPPQLASLQNLDLPLTQKLPSLGNNWGPRASFAWGAEESHWPILRVGYGMYFGRMPNAVVETALTQTGSLKGDLNFFIRPTDNLNAGGAPPFPYVLSGEPTSAVRPGAVEFAQGFRNGEVHQAEASLEQTLPGHLHLEASAVASLGRRLPITLDANIDLAANPKTITYAVVDGNGSGPIKSPQLTVPFYAMWPSTSSSTGFSGRLNSNYQQISELFSRANSTYEAAMLRLIRNGHGFTIHVRYTYAHALDWNPDESTQVSGSSVLDPIDFRQEYGTSSLDVRHISSATLIWEPKWKLRNQIGKIVNGWMLSGVGQFHSGRPYSMHTAGSLAREFNVLGAAIVGLSTGMNGYGGDNRVYGVGRNTFRYPATWKADMRLGKQFNLGQMRQLELLAESFNLFNHQNVTELETVGYSIESGSLSGSMPRLNFLTGLKTGQTEFGQPLNVNATDYYRERQIQFGARIHF